MVYFLCSNYTFPLLPTQISRKTLGRRKAEWEFWTRLMDPRLNFSLIQNAAIIFCRAIQEASLNFSGSLTSNMQLYNICEQLQVC